MKRKAYTGGVIALLVTVAWIASAVAWSPPKIGAYSAGCELADVSVSNPEGSVAHVVASNVFPVGATVPAHAALAVQIAGTGTIHITVTLDFPDHATASTDFTFTTCPRETTTTTTPQETTTTTTPGSTLPPPVVQCLGQPAHERTTGEEPCTPPMVTSPHFTG
jgi:hypothetical protein